MKELCKKHGVVHKNGGYPSCNSTPETIEELDKKIDEILKESEPTPPPPDIEVYISKAIEECIGVFGTDAYRGSYAAPREAFRKILRHALAEYGEKCKQDALSNNDDLNAICRDKIRFGYLTALDEAIEAVMKVARIDPFPSQNGLEKALTALKNLQSLKKPKE